MNIIGLTGGIGSGKTIVSQVFMRLGIAVYNSDTEAKIIMNSDSDIINKLKMIFGYDIYDKRNQLDRKKLAQHIFNNKDKLNTVNSIVHPAVKKHFTNWINKQQSPYIIKETAILFESGIYKDVKKIITVIAPLELRIKRIKERDNMTDDKIIQRINNQTDDNFKIKHSDYIIINDEKELIIPQILKIHEKLTENL
ncbi:MAG: dephospho-CoA kinase [Chlorobi bacterium]|nr:dephospho-CoA kinase [Chlorobiota bacterium]